MREIARTAEVLEVVDTAPMPVHVLHFDRRVPRDERVQQMRHVERVEVRPRTQLTQGLLDLYEPVAAHLQDPDPTSVPRPERRGGRPILRVAGAVGRIRGTRDPREQHRLAEEAAIVAAGTVGEVPYGAVVCTRRRGIDDYAQIRLALDEVTHHMTAEQQISV